jgi:hypothetical protein
VIRDIADWLTKAPEDQKQPHRMYWLHGVAGCGKSTIAKSVAELLEANGRCVSFFFNASNQAEAGPHNLFSTLSRDLADCNKEWKAALISVVKGLSTKERLSRAVEDQFKHLILQPAEKFEYAGPILIVIDALDECGSVKERAPVLQMLKRLLDLPENFRFLITSRAEKDIQHALRSDDRIYPCQLDRTDPSSTDRDIRLYVEKQLRSIHELNDEWNKDWVEKIVTRAGQLFQWAFTACEYIKGEGQVGDEPRENLQVILDSTSFGGLDELYRRILDKLCTFKPGDDVHRRFENVMGCILLLHEPLSLESLSALYHEDDDKGKLKNILSPLGSLLRGVGGGGEPIQPLHASFIDFLTDVKRSGKYCVDQEKQKEKLPHTLFREMQICLKFNICELETSYQSNRDIEGLDKRVKACIPEHVVYACTYWGDHLVSATNTDKRRIMVDRFMRTKFLFWLETLSLMKKTDVASKQISRLQDWLAFTVYFINP